MQKVLNRILFAFRILLIGILISIPVLLFKIFFLELIKQEFSEVFLVVVTLLGTILIIGYAILYNYVNDKILMTKQYLYAILLILVIFSIAPIFQFTFYFISEQFGGEYGLVYLVLAVLLTFFLTRKSKSKN